jgi:hypothetical protein
VVKSTFPYDLFGLTFGIGHNDQSNEVGALLFSITALLNIYVD